MTYIFKFENDYKCFIHILGPLDGIFLHCKSITDYFLVMLDEKIRAKIVYQTDLFAVQKGKWFAPIDDREFLGFLAINLFMGYHSLPNLNCYWMQDEDQRTKIV